MRGFAVAPDVFFESISAKEMAKAPLSVQGLVQVSLFVLFSTRHYQVNGRMNRGLLSSLSLHLDSRRWFRSRFVSKVAGY